MNQIYKKLKQLTLEQEMFMVTVPEGIEKTVDVTVRYLDNGKVLAVDPTSVVFQYIIRAFCIPHVKPLRVWGTPDATYIIKRREQ